MKTYIQHIVENIKGSKSVIDIGIIGTGTGRKNIKRHDAFAKAAKNIVATDNKKKLIDFAKSIGYNKILLSDITSEGDVDDLLRRYGTFDHIIFTDVIEHIGNLTTALDNIYRLMNKKSRLYISTPNAASSFFHKRFKHRRKINYQLKPDGDTICWFCENTLIVLLKRSNLAPVFIQEADHHVLFFIVKKYDDV
jgi:2-polyprenyl-3-methyl-5-hydroxy-6-metoxy-1,4-benzoquinol methylase